ncbi:MAG: U32 family peptidase [Candidatus Gracilibacteria bacterium]|nr:U32 family peptidase [Candidatus Gracilibacteria bacterium]
MPDYIKSLVDSGAGEFFTGYNPPYWSDKFGFEVSPNGRFSEHEQITSLETLKETVEEVHKYDLEIFANLNAWYYTDETFPIIKEMVKEFIEIGMDGIICGNISILEYLTEINYSGKINISTILAAYNKESIRFYLDNYKINKIILSREVTLKEIEDIAKEFPETKFEVFGEGDFCRYNNGLCFAEHKYGARDICTVVVNDLVIKKRYRPDFKELILDENKNNIEKIEELNDEYIDDFGKIEDIILKIDNISLFQREYPKGEGLLVDNLEKIILKNKNRVDLFFDGLKPLNSENNKKILAFLRGLRILNKQLGRHKVLPLRNSRGEPCVHPDLQHLEEELNNSFKSYMKYNKQKIQEIGGEAKLKALELQKFYSKGDNLNLYNYLFFSEIPNVDTVKFPTRGRNYEEKLKLIEEVLQSEKVDEKYIDRGISLERAHYDLTYLFKEKNWFRKILSEK